MINKNKFIIFKQSFNAKYCYEINNFLNKNGIKTETGDNKPTFDLTFSNTSSGVLYEVRIHPKDFSLANELLLMEANAQLGEMPKEYYLFDFTNQELYDVVKKSDEWNEYDYAFAMKILQERGKDVSTEKINRLRQERKIELSAPDQSKKGWIVLGFILVLFQLLFPTFLGAVIGLAIGYNIYSSQNILPDGSSVFVYGKDDRNYGKYIIGGVLCSSIIGLFFFSKNFNFAEFVKF